MFHRIGAAAYRPDLGNIVALTERLNHPHRNFKTIHVAGTNGKGSVSNMLASVLQESGYKTGLFTSPHLKDFRERIRVNGKMIDEETVTQFVEDYKQLFDDISPSFFEWTTALCFKYFSDEAVDVAVIETGLGGRLDSTNIILPELSIITNISYDHMNLLGDTLQKIAGEKAGIIKQNIPVVIGERQEECEEVFISHAKEKNAALVFASDNYEANIVSSSTTEQKLSIVKGEKKIFGELSIDLPGNYQLKNICTALQSLELLKIKFPKINDNNITAGLSHIRKNTELAGRWQVLSHNPLTIADVGHNEAGIKFVIEQLNALIKQRHLKPASELINAGDTLQVNRETNLQTGMERLHIVFGMVGDKNPDSVLALLPKDAVYYFCNADIPRAMNVNDLKNAAVKFNLKGESFSSVANALNAARKNATKDDLIFVGGSTFVVAEII